MKQAIHEVEQVATYCLFHILTTGTYSGLGAGRPDFSICMMLNLISKQILLFTIKSGPSSKNFINATLH